jgi:AcrR family transcriptional regulator
VPTVKERPYHHGRLREALLEAAVALIQQQGTSGWTLREAARQAGVSHGAPYRHFRSKEDLLATLAVEGFQGLQRAFEVALQAAGPDQAEQLVAIGAAQVRFARAHPAHYRVMYGRDLGDRQLMPAVQEAAQAAYMTFVEVVRAAQESRTVKPGRVSELCLTAWATLHGLAQILDAGMVPEAAADAQAEALARRVARHLMDGLAPRPPGVPEGPPVGPGDAGP